MLMDVTPECHGVFDDLAYGRRDSGQSGIIADRLLIRKGEVLWCISHNTSSSPRSLIGSTACLTDCACLVVVTNNASGVSTTTISSTPINAMTREVSVTTTPFASSTYTRGVSPITVTPDSFAAGI